MISQPSPLMRPDVARRIAVVIPAYNEAWVIASVVDGLLPLGCRVVVVDDGSADCTAATVANRPVMVVRHPINRGQGAALQTGITVAVALGADIVVTFDADGQHDPQDISRLVEPILSGECDVTLGSRFLGCAENIPRSRKLLLRAAVVFTRLTARLAVSDAHNGLRAFTRSAAAGLRITMDGMAHASEILDQIRAHGWRWREVPVTIHYSAYSLAKGQRSGNALRIAGQILLAKLSR